MLEIKRHKDENGRLCLTLSGEITIQEAPTLRQELMTGFQEERVLRLSLAEVSEMDLTAFQLFCSAHRTALAGDKQFSIDPDMPAHIAELVKGVGLERGRGCATSADPSSCLWAKEIPQ